MDPPTPITPIDLGFLFCSCARSLAISVAGFTKHERLVRPSVVTSILAASACWVAAAVGFHFARESRKAAAVWVLLPPSLILAHGLAVREHQTIHVLFEYCGSLLLAYVIRDRLIYPASWIDVLGTIAATPVRCHSQSIGRDMGTGEKWEAGRIDRSKWRKVSGKGGYFHGNLVQLV